MWLMFVTAGALASVYSLPMAADMSFGGWGNVSLATWVVGTGGGIAVGVMAMQRREASSPTRRILGCLVAALTSAVLVAVALNWLVVPNADRDTGLASGIMVVGHAILAAPVTLLITYGLGTLVHRRRFAGRAPPSA